MTKIAVASRSFSAHPQLREEVLKRYPDAKFNDAGKSLSGTELIEFLTECEKAVIALEVIDGPTLDRLPDLKVISKYGVGFDKIDLRALLDRDIHLGWTGGVNKRSVSELVIAFAISLLRFVPQSNKEVLDGGWRQWKGRQLTDRTFGIIGCGHVGKDLGRILRSGFGCMVLAHDIEDFPEYYEETGVTPVDLKTLYRDADVISLHLPYNHTTAGLIDAAAFAQMSPDTILINTARGGLVDEVALRDALEKEQIAAAAFDVFEMEPPTNFDLLSQPNFIATPHIGGSAAEAILAMGLAAIDGLDDHQLPAPGSFPPGPW
jgi:phosphoglycerate dehydrogenase-like enzyme